VTTYRLGVDIGGTFTDFALLDRSTGRVVGYKSPTTPSDPAEGVITGLHELLRQHNIEPSQVEYFVHGTTIGLNTVIQRSGANLAFMTTEGFRDVLEIQRMRLSDPLNFAATRPAPLIPRWQVFEIRERILTTGAVEVGLDRESVVRAFEAARAQHVDGVVVCLMNAYRNPQHEAAVRAIGAEVAPDMYVACSHAVWPQIREYERAIVAILNAYIRPRLAAYFDTLADRLHTAGLRVEPYITRSNGGVMTARSARDTPVQTLLSGPASGVIGAVHAAQLAGFTDLLTLDMGGTSADIAVVRNGEPQYSRDEHVGDFPVIMPSVGVSSIGAGGGSIAWIDRSGLLKVGPRSAGADPGPACYGRGGREPTLTDAFLLSGFIDPHKFLGGRIQLDPQRARGAIQSLADQLSLSVEAAADAIVEVSTANMYAEFSQVMARHGLDPRAFTLVAFGGAGPIQACFLAAEFHIPRVLVPLSPGILCALGALGADVRNEYVRTVNSRLGPDTVQCLQAIADTLREQAETWLLKEGPVVTRTELTYAAEMRYRRQAFEIEVPVQTEWLQSGDAPALLEAFHALHRQLYGHADASEPVDLISLQVKITGEMPKPVAQALPTGGSRSMPNGERSVSLRGRVYRARTYARSDLQPGDMLEGPLVIDQEDTTVLVPSGFEASVDLYGNVVIVQSNGSAGA
jgi:N-methylhydantoinase A